MSRAAGGAARRTQKTWRGTWLERDGMLWSPLLASQHVTAGSTTRAQGSMAGSRHPLHEQARNRAALARTLGFDAVARVKQVHGNDVVRLDAPGDPWPSADALWTDRSGVLLAVAAADCVPVLVADPEGPIGAAHAGWQGTTLRVAEALVEAMVAGGRRGARASGRLAGAGDRSLLLRHRHGARDARERADRRSLPA